MMWLATKDLHACIENSFSRRVCNCQVGLGQEPVQRAKSVQPASASSVEPEALARQCRAQSGVACFANMMRPSIIDPFAAMFMLPDNCCLPAVEAI